MYQVVGVETSKVYAELDYPEECHRYIQKKFPSERIIGNKMMAVNPILPEPMKIFKKQEGK